MPATTPRRWATAVVSALLFSLAALPAAAAARDAEPPALERLTAEQRQTHADAVAAFRAHRYAAAYGRFAALANQGHVASAKVALLMVESGPALFGSDWSASAPEQARWRALVINHTRDAKWRVDNARGD